ncbi:hypothetical protein CJD36_002390 [Flavipsychrobacter stenotrophus]|uniref:histidine kinase n=1 Tax=Flavipsychrobacter stenotrophus TaxID=2077091 RepID=A0A2S7T0X5_9BACT|nr:tetratricopeptide repeat-containing sensor histidine kinase [Flavipsychrobacter stenotrophus]PQJ12614.1 hypothetical protein CJD36_002390 [Flavipsychrobacter stenotrophus]
MLSLNCLSSTWRLIVILSVCLLLTSPNVSAQKLDSLKGALTEYAHDDTNKVSLMLRVGKEYQRQSLDSMEALTSRAKVLSQKIHFLKGEADALTQMAYVCVYKAQPEKAMLLVRQADVIYEKTGDYLGRIKGANIIAIVYYRNVAYDSALKYFNQILAYTKMANAYDDQKGKALSSIGTIYSEKGNHAEAIKYFLEALKVQEKINEKENIGITLSRIAATYALLNDYNKAREFISRCVASLDGIKETPVRLSNYANIGGVFGQMNEQDSALVYFYKALALADSAHDQYWHNIATVDIAEIYWLQKKYDLGLAAYKESMSGAEKTGQTNIFLSGQLGVGRILVETGKAAEGIKYLQRSYDLFMQNGIKEQAAEAAETISDGYAKLNDYKNALLFHKKSVGLRDTLRSEKSKREIEQLQFDYQLQKKQSQIELLNKDKVIARSNDSRKNAVMTGLASALCLLVVIVVLLYRSRQKEKENNALVSAQKDAIQLQAKKLEELNLFKDTTFSVLSHDLRAPLNAFITTVDMLNEGDLPYESFLALSPAMNKQLGSLHMLIDNLLKWSRSHIKGAESLRVEQVDMWKIANDNVVIAQSNAEKKQMTLKNDVVEHTTAIADAGQIDVVIRNLISNAIKFTNAGGSVTVTSEKVGNMIHVSVTDTGVGMTTDQKRKLFTSAIDNVSWGTKGEKGVGIGLLLCYEFVRSNGGDIKVESTPGVGSTFTVILPAA